MNSKITRYPCHQTALSEPQRDGVENLKNDDISKHDHGKPLSVVRPVFQGKSFPRCNGLPPGVKAGVRIATISNSRKLAREQQQSPRLPLPVLEPASQVEATRAMLRNRLDVIAAHLNDLDRTYGGKKLKIFVGCEDFLRGNNIAANVCMDPETVYQTIATDMRNLSRQHPGVVFCPGTVYVSTDIPLQHGANNLKFDQDGRRARLDSTTCYTTNLMPVLFDGEIVAIIRKGERVGFQKVTSAIKKKVALQPLDSIDELPHFINQPGRLLVTSYHEDDLTDLTDYREKNSTCYLGKTLLPGERHLIEKYILKGSERSIEDLGRHDPVIAGKRFLFLVCAEFRLTNPDGDNISTVGKLLCDDTVPPFDFIIHSSVGGDVPHAMQKNARWYVHADFGGSNKVLATDSDHSLVPVVLEDPDSDSELFLY